MNGVIHFEIPAEDVARCRDFYARVFDWQIHPMPELDYTAVQTTETDADGMVLTRGAVNGGIFERKEPLHHPMITINVPDIDQALGRVEQTGGKTVLPRQPVGEMGYVGYFADPEGNVVGLWENAR